MSAAFGLERTLAIIKPHAIRHRFAILRRIQMAGFHVLKERCVKLTMEQATEFLLRKCDDNKVLLEIQNLSSGPMIVLCLARLNAVEEWKRLMGPENFSTARISAPTSLQALYGDRDIETKNAVYGSQSVDDVGRELRFFFPNMILEPINFVDDYLSANIHQPLTDALYEMIKTKPDEPLVWLANYMLEHNSNKPIIHQADPDTMQLLMGLKDKGKSAKMTLKNDGAPENCGCYLTAASSVTSPATAH